MSSISLFPQSHCLSAVPIHCPRDGDCEGAGRGGPLHGRARARIQVVPGRHGGRVWLWTIVPILGSSAYEALWLRWNFAVKSQTVNVFWGWKVGHHQSNSCSFRGKKEQLAQYEQWDGHHFPLPMLITCRNTFVQLYNMVLIDSQSEGRINNIADAALFLHFPDRLFWRTSDNGNALP